MTSHRFAISGLALLLLGYFVGSLQTSATAQALLDLSKSKATQSKIGGLAPGAIATTPLDPESGSSRTTDPCAGFRNAALGMCRDRQLDTRLRRTANIGASLLDFSSSNGYGFNSSNCATKADIKGLLEDYKTALAEAKPRVGVAPDPGIMAGGSDDSGDPDGTAKKTDPGSFNPFCTGECRKIKERSDKGRDLEKPIDKPDDVEPSK